MAVHELLNVDVEAISIVGKGANRQVFFLRKEHRDVGELLELTSRPELIKAADWSAVYCVVAEPGALEDAGMTGDQAIPDRWANEDEIRKAAHRFVKGGALVNKMHESLEPYGQLVESAVALGDFTVNGQTIRKGSWYVAIEPNEEGKRAIEDGTFTGISIQGSGVRKRVAKSAADAELWEIAKALEPTDLDADDLRFAERVAKHVVMKDAALVPNKPGKTNWVQRLGGLPKKIADLAGDLISEKQYSTSRAIATAVAAAKRFAAKGKAEWVAAVARWEAMKAASHVSKSDSGTVGKSMKEALRKIGRAVGLSEEDLADLDADDLAKQSQTFAAIMASRELSDELPDAMDALRSAIWQSFYPMATDAEGDVGDSRDLISQSLDEFKSWCLDLYDRVGGPVAKSGDGGQGDALFMALVDELPDPVVKRMIPTDKRIALAQKGHAIPIKNAKGEIVGGRYPIQHVGDLKNAISAMGRGKVPDATLAAHLKRSAKRLKAENMLPDHLKKTGVSDGDAGNVGSVEGEERTLEEQVGDLSTKLDELPAAIAKAIKGESDDEDAPTLESVSKSVDELTESLTKVAADVKKLGSGNSTQREPKPEPVEKTDWKPDRAPAGVL